MGSMYDDTITARITFPVILQGETRPGHRSGIYPAFPVGNGRRCACQEQGRRMEKPDITMEVNHMETTMNNIHPDTTCTPAAETPQPVTNCMVAPAMTPVPAGAAIPLV